MSRISEAFDKHETSIRRVIARYRPLKDDVDELTQETFLKCFAAEMRQDIQNPKAFLLRVAKNVAISEAKKKRHATEFSYEETGGPDVYTVAGSISAEDEVLSRQKLRIAVEALASLSPEYRRALLMRKVDCLKYKQIAIRLGVSVSTVEKRVATALLECDIYFRSKGLDPLDFGAPSKQISKVDKVLQLPRFPEKRSKR